MVANPSRLWTLAGSGARPSHYLEPRRLSRAPALGGWLVSFEILNALKLSPCEMLNGYLLESKGNNPKYSTICKTPPFPNVLCLS